MEREAADAQASAAQAHALAPVFDDDEYEPLGRRSGSVGGMAGLSDPGGMPPPPEQFSLQLPVSRPLVSGREAGGAASPMSPPPQGRRHTPPGGGFTVTTGIDPRMTTDPLQVTPCGVIHLSRCNTELLPDCSQL